MKKIDFAQVIFYVTLTGLGAVLCFALGLYSGATRNAVLDLVLDTKNSIALVFEEASTLTGAKPTHFIQPSLYPGSGVTKNLVASHQENDLILLSGFFEDGNEIRLIQRDGTLVQRWPVKFSEHFPNTDHLLEPPATDWNVDTHGALALADGSILFNYEYSGLVKLDRCGELTWSLAKPAHHSIEKAADAYWVPGRRYHAEGQANPFLPFQLPYLEDTLMKVSADGQVLTEISVPALFFNSNLESLLTATGVGFLGRKPGAYKEIVHLNKISELDADLAEAFPRFQAGDLVLSLRRYNLVMVVDPVAQKVKWHSVGPWLRQHDPEFTEDGKIVVFNNNVFAIPDATDAQSNIIEIDPMTNLHRVVYGG